MVFDNLEYINIEKQTTAFPKHYHETFCISLIHQGIEEIEFDDYNLFSEAGTISITNPYEIHANPLVCSDNPVKFDTIYMSNDLMKYLLNGNAIIFKNKQVQNIKANRLFEHVKQTIDYKDAKAIENALQQFVHSLKHHAKVYEDEYAEPDLHDLNPIKLYIENEIHSKFNLDELSRMANINKFGFSRKFKILTGMSPMNYILMRKVFSCKNIIDKDSELTEIAFQYNFADMAHFSKTFKRYIGISPKAYKESLL